MIRLYIGDVGDYLADIAKNHDENAFLLDHKNVDNYLNSRESITVYTSLPDLPKITRDRNIAYEVLDHADEIHYCQPEQWSDATKEFSIHSSKIYIEFLLSHIHQRKNNVVGLELTDYENSPYLSLEGVRKKDQKKSLWIAGCSTSHGVGVNLNERYGSILERQLEINATFLTKPGSSVEWATDQILRSDIRKGDILVWGITSEWRAPKIVNGIVIPDDDIDILTDETRIYKAVTSMYQILNFTRKIGVHLIMFSVGQFENLPLYVANAKEYVWLPYRHRHLDFGNDGAHPGPEQHREYAKYILEKINEMV